MLTPTDNVSWERAVENLLADPIFATLARDCYFDGTAEEAAVRYWSSHEWRAVRDLLGSDRGRALDVGAGRGIASYALARDGWNVCALEPDPSDLVGAGAILHMAANAQLDIQVFRGFGEQLPFDDRSFDLVFARQALHHAHDLPTLIRELHRVLRPGGRLIAIRDHVISKRGDLTRFFELHPLHRFYGGENAFLLDDYRAALMQAGFKGIRVLAPFDSVINFAPIPPEKLPTALADRLPNLPGVRATTSRMLSSPLLMRIARRVLGWVDERPGRLFSFSAVRADQ